MSDDKDSRFTVRVEPALRKRMRKWIKKRGYTNESELVREALRTFLDDLEQET